MHRFFALNLALIVALQISFASASQTRLAGSNTYGQLGNGEKDWSREFIEIAENVVSVSSAEYGTHTVFVDSQNRLWGIGLDINGELGGQAGLDFTSTPLLLDTGVRFAQASSNWTFYIKEDGSVYAAGTRNSGDSIWNGPSPRLMFQVVDELDSISKLDSYFTHSLFLTENGELFGLGSNFSLGVDGNINEPVLLAEDIIDAGAWDYRALYLTAEGDLIDATIYRYANTPVASDVTGFSGANNTLFIIKDGDLFVKGTSTNGALGLGEGITSANTFTLVASDVSKVIAQTNNAYYLDDSGNLWGMGDNVFGQLSANDFATRYSPVLIKESVADFAANDANVFIIDDAGTLYSNGRRQYATGDVPGSAVPVPQYLSDGYKYIYAGLENYFFIDESDELWVLGENSKGRLGTGDQIHKLTPTKTLSGVAKVSGNIEFTLFTMLDGRLLAAGNDYLDSLGFEEAITTDPQVMDTDVKHAIAGQSFASYLKNDGTLWRRGLLSGSSLDDEDFSLLQLASNVQSFDAHQSVYYIDDNNDLHAIGAYYINGYKAATQSDQVESPLKIDEEVEIVASKSGFVTYIKSDKTLWATGAARFLNPSFEFVATPRKLDDQVIQVDANLDSIMYQKMDGSVWYIGYNSIHAPGVDLPSSQTPAYPVQIWPGAPIESFSHAGNNVAFLTGEIDAPSNPSIEVQYGGNGDSSLLGAANGDFLTFNWYEGEQGDRSNPITTAYNAQSLDLALYDSAAYWLEIENEGGAIAVSISSDNAQQLAAYSTWAEANSLEGWDALYQADPDNDGLANLAEFAFRLNPQAYDILDLEGSIDSNSQSYLISFPTPESGVVIETLIRYETDAPWTPASEVAGSQVIIGDSIQQVTVPLSSLDPTALAKIKVSPQD